jgi:hypothetical protein
MDLSVQTTLGQVQTTKMLEVARSGCSPPLPNGIPSGIPCPLFALLPVRLHRVFNFLIFYFYIIILCSCASTPRPSSRGTKLFCTSPAEGQPCLAATPLLCWSRKVLPCPAHALASLPERRGRAAKQGHGLGLGLLLSSIGVVCCAKHDPLGMRSTTLRGCEA